MLWSWISGSLAPHKALLERGLVPLPGFIFISGQYPGIKGGEKCAGGMEAQSCVPHMAGGRQAEKQLVWALSAHPDD